MNTNINSLKAYFHKKKEDKAFTGSMIELVDFVSEANPFFQSLQLLEGLEGKQSVLLIVNSGGGNISEALQAVDFLKRLKASNEDLRLIGYIVEQCASAAYWIASQCHELYADLVLEPVQDIGGIGVIDTRIDHSEALKNQGINVTAFVSNENKLSHDPDFPPTEEEKQERLQRVQALARIFYQDVADARGISPLQVEQLNARTFPGLGAVENKLIDGLLRFDELVAKIEDVIISNETTNNDLNMSNTGLSQEQIDDLKSRISALEQELKESQSSLQAYKAKEAEQEKNQLLALQNKLASSYQAAFGTSIDLETLNACQNLGSKELQSLVDRYNTIAKSSSQARIQTENNVQAAQGGSIDQEEYKKALDYIYGTGGNR